MVKFLKVVFTPLFNASLISLLVSHLTTGASSWLFFAIATVIFVTDITDITDTNKENK